ncbi:hypothetical protein FBQ97_10405 [Acidobacteria bacterium ACD]|nr:hypothetical protein [Acidobacteria bacterium ACD]
MLRAVLLTLLVPGLGHVSIGDKRRGAAFFALVATAFAVGLALDGGIPRTATSPFSAIALVATTATGVLSAGVRLLGLGAGDPASPTSEYGEAYLLTAGTMNLLLVVDLLVRRLREAS